MTIYAPDYYREFECIADKCCHTCCQGWEIDVDETSLSRFYKIRDISKYISNEGSAHIQLDRNERCPFLRDDGLCRIILDYGEDMLCDICRDHPRFRNYWTDRIEIGLGMVCESAGRLILSKNKPMCIIKIDGDKSEQDLPEDEQWLMDYRTHLLDSIEEEGPKARLLEYLIYRHIPDALYDGMVEERTAFIFDAYNEIISAWAKTDGSMDALIECVRIFSYTVEYDDEILIKKISKFSKEST